MRWLKIIVSVFLLFIFVCLLALSALIYFFDPNQIKPVLIEKIKQETGYQIKIDGKITWSLYPKIGIKINHLLINSPDQPNFIFDANQVRIAGDLMQLLKNKNKLNGDIYISHLNFMNVNAENISVNVNVNDNAKIVNFNSINASLYQGKLQGSAKGNNLSTKPHWQWNMQVSDVQVQPLLKDIHGPNSKINISGIGQLTFQGEMNIASQFLSRKQLFDALNGKGEFKLNNGIVQGIDINYFLQTANAIFNKEATLVPNNTNQTVFENVIGNFDIKSGVLETNNLLLTAPAFFVKGQGQIILNSSEINFKLQAKPQLENANIHWDIPILITGNLDKPDARLDMSAIQKVVTNKELDKVKDKVIKKINEVIPGKTGEFLQNLLGR